MTTQHTPGPWKWKRWTLVGPSEGHQLPPTDILVLSRDEQDSTALVNYDNECANARLIAAAPCLLAALRKLAQAAEHRENTMGDQCRLLECKANLEDAARIARIEIQKATGGDDRL